MSIDPIAAGYGAQAGRKAKSASEQQPGVPFQEYLAGSGPAAEVTPETAAEVLRLKMLSSALYLDDEGAAAPRRSLGVQGLLDRFLEQLPATGAEQPGPVPGEGGAEDTVAPSLAPSAPVAARENLAGDPATEAIIERASRRYGVDSGLIRAVIRVESNFNPRAVSSVGAQGLMQLMPGTARGLGVTDSFDPEQNVMAGTRFLKDLLRRYHGNLDETLAAYNWGPGKVDRNGTDHLPRETRAYLARVKEYYTG